VRLRAAFFDVGDTLVEGWSPPDALGALLRAALVTAFGERDWYDRFVAADLEHPDPADPVNPAHTGRQDTLGWFARWFAAEGIHCDIDLDRLRVAAAIPLEDVSRPVPGAADAVRWCRAHGLRVVLVTNTLSRGDAEVLGDWERAGLADHLDGIVSSHDTGWRKPHPAMFERALALAGVGAEAAAMIGDDPEADIRGARRLGLRTVYRRTATRPLPPDIHPDAIVDDLTTLPEVLRRWL
jgi:FMN phosphatase YigB (HAD superfamily)